MGIRHYGNGCGIGPCSVYVCLHNDLSGFRLIDGESAKEELENTPKELVRYPAIELGVSSITAFLLSNR